MLQLELWAAAALLLLGAAVSLCIRCQLSATKRKTQLNQQRSQLESQQRFEVIRSNTTATRRLEKFKEPENLSIARKAEELSGSHYTDYGSRNESRYQNFLADSCMQEDTAYVEPISLDYYYNCTRFFKPPRDRSPGKRAEKDEDSYSYENVTIGASQGSDPGDAVDYENSTVIHTWKLQQGQASLTESQDDEPDYINTGPGSGPALLSKQSILHNI